MPLACTICTATAPTGQPTTWAPTPLARRPIRQEQPTATAGSRAAATGGIPPITAARRRAWRPNPPSPVTSLASASPASRDGHVTCHDPRWLELRFIMGRVYFLTGGAGNLACQLTFKLRDAERIVLYDVTEHPVAAV